MPQRVVIGLGLLVAAVLGLIAMRGSSDGRLLASSASPSPRPSVTATVAPIVLPVVAPPSPTPTEPPPPPPQAFVIANTGGAGAYLRRSPRLGDRIRAYIEGTQVQDLGETTTVENVEWRKVRAPDGTEGWIPAEYLKPAG